MARKQIPLVKIKPNSIGADVRSRLVGLPLRQRAREARRKRGTIAKGEAPAQLRFDFMGGWE